MSLHSFENHVTLHSVYRSITLLYNPNGLPKENICQNYMGLVLTVAHICQCSHDHVQYVMVSHDESPYLPAPCENQTRIHELLFSYKGRCT